MICNVYADQEAELKKERDAVLKMLQSDSKKSPPKVEASMKSEKSPNKKKEVE